MSNSPARALRNSDQRLIDTMQQLEIDYINRLKVVVSDSAISFSGLGSAGAQTPGTPSQFGNFLPTAGGVMIGPISDNPMLKTLISNSFDVTPNTGLYTGYLILGTQSGLTDELHQITGASHDGQRIKIQGIQTETITIKNDPSGVGSGGYNIRTPERTDYKLIGQNTVELYFDPVANQWAFDESSIFDNVTSGGNVATWSEFPALVDVNLGGFALTNFNNLRTKYTGIDILFNSNEIQFVASPSPPDSSSHIDFFVNGAEKLELDNSQIQILEQVNFNGFDVVNLLRVNFADSDVIQSFAGSGNGISYKVVSPQTNHEFFFNSTPLVSINNIEFDMYEQLNMHSNDITNLNRLDFGSLNKITNATSGSNELDYIVGFNQKHSFYVNDVTKAFDVEYENIGSSSVAAIVMDSSAFIDFNNLALSATAGFRSIPTLAAGFITILVGGTKFKVAFFNV